MPEGAIQQGIDVIICITCKNNLPESSFNKKASKKNGLNGECRECGKSRSWYGAFRKTTQKTREYKRKWYAENKEMCDARSLAWYHRNPVKGMARANRYKTRKILRMPIWANAKKIERIYDLASWASRFTSEPLEVDHIIPLKGRIASGLHVENNLQIISRRENRSKSNKFTGY